MSQELGLAGRTLKSIVVADQIDIPANGATPVGEYAMVAPVIQGSTQVRVNDSNVYPSAVKSVTHHLTEVEAAMNRPLSVATRAEYDGGINLRATAVGWDAIHQIDNTVQFCGKPMSELSGTRHCEGVSLISDPVSRRGTAIRDKPVEYTRILQRTRLDNNYAKISRYYCEVEKAFRIKDGRVSVMV